MLEIREINRTKLLCCSRIVEECPCRRTKYVTTISKELVYSIHSFSVAIIKYLSRSKLKETDYILVCGPRWLESALVGKGMESSRSRKLTDHTHTQEAKVTGSGARL